MQVKHRVQSDAACFVCSGSSLRLFSSCSSLHSWDRNPWLGFISLFSLKNQRSSRINKTAELDIMLFALLERQRKLPSITRLAKYHFTQRHIFESIWLVGENNSNSNMSELSTSVQFTKLPWCLGWQINCKRSMLEETTSAIETYTHSKRIHSGKSDVCEEPLLHLLINSNAKIKRQF